MSYQIYMFKPYSVPSHKIAPTYSWKIVEFAWKDEQKIVIIDVARSEWKLPAA